MLHICDTKGMQDITDQMSKLRDFKSYHYNSDQMSTELPNPRPISEMYRGFQLSGSQSGAICCRQGIRNAKPTISRRLCIGRLDDQNTVHTLSLETPALGKETITPPNSSPMCRNTSPLLATKKRWCFGSTVIESSTTLS